MYLDQAERLFAGSDELGLYNVGGGMQNNVSLLELINFLDGRYLGEKLELNFTDWRQADQKIYISDTSKVEKDFEWKQEMGWEDGIHRIWLEIKDLDEKGLL